MRPFHLLIIAGAALVLPAGAPAMDLPIRTWELDNGARALYVHRPQLPMVTVQVDFGAGSARDPENRPGLAALTFNLLDDGAGDRGADAFARALDGLGAKLATGSDRDRGWVRFSLLSEAETVRQGGELLGEVLAEPRFVEQALERERRRQVTGIRKDREDPHQVAIKAFYRAVYGDHPYAHPPEGTIEGLRRVERGDLKDFHGRHFVGRNATVAVVGDLGAERARSLLRRTVGRLPAGEPPEPLPEVPQQESGEQVFVERDISQAHVLMGQPASERGAPDHFPLLVGNYSLGGGGFSSRLMEVVREEHGLSYSVFSTFQPLARRGPFLAGLQTRGDRLGKALGLLREEVASFVADGPTAKELEAAQKYLTGSFPLRIDSNQKIVDYLAMIGFYGLETDYLERFTGRVEAVTRPEIRRSMAERLDPERMVTVIVGGPAARDSLDEGER